MCPFQMKGQHTAGLQRRTSAMTTRRQGLFDDLTNDRSLMRDPNDSSSSVPWDDRTTSQQGKCLKLYREILKRTNVSWVIKISLKGPPTEEQVWPHIIYPLRFNSQADAWDYLHLSPDPALRPAGFRSWSVETIRNPRPKDLPEPKVRRKDLIENSSTQVVYYG
jgi:hypothetical protein